MENIYVTNSVNQVKENGDVYILCYMSDGSQWTCDIDGTNWQQQKLTDAELTKLFKKNATSDKKIEADL